MFYIVFVSFQDPGPPSYFDLGKQVRELFSNGYNFGLLSLNIITKSPNNGKFTTTCVESLNRRNLFGSLEAQYEIFDSIIFTEKWNTDCVMSSELCCKNKPINDVTITLFGSISPRNGHKMGSLELEWVNRFCALTAKLELGKKFSLFTSSAVFKYKGLLGGVLTKIDPHSLRLNDYNLAAGFKNEDLTLHTAFSNGSECECSIFHTVSPKVDAGVHFVYSTNKKSDILFGVAGRYQLDENICIRGKIHNLSQLGLGCEQRLRGSVVLTFSVLFDVRYFAEGKYKIGFSIQFES